MDYVSHAVVIPAILVALLLTPSHQQTAAPNSKCMEDFSNALVGCVKEGGLNIGNFLWFVTNGTSPKSETPSSQDAFKTQICGVQQQVGACAIQKVGSVLNTTACMGTSTSTSQVETITRQVASIFGTYDLKCMHPCRNSLFPELQQCYTSNGVDSKLFVSNSSTGAVIGATEDETSKFCGARQKILSCMKEKSDACPESPRILTAIGLNFTAFNKLADTLCSNVKTYLTGLVCFAESTNDVQVCQQKQSQSMTQLQMQASQGNWTEDRFYASYCEIAVEFISCDIYAWSKKNHEACVPSVIGLRRSLECEFLAAPCKANTKLMEKPDNVCNPTKLGTSLSVSVHAYVYLPLMILILFTFIVF